MKQIAIIGGGVAGLTAAVYALRANAEVTLFEQFGLGGLTATIASIENYPSYKSVEGWQLASNVADQAKSLGLKTVRSRVLSLTKDGDTFTVTTDKGQFQFPAVVVATGTAHNKLGFESPYVGKGVSYCATCDGNFYKNLPVAVVGGGNQAVKEALYLADICSAVYVIVPNKEFSAEERAVSELLQKKNVKVLYNCQVSAIHCDDVVTGADVFDGKNTHKLQVKGIFIAIGALPVTEFINIEGLDRKNGYLVVDGRAETNIAGLFAAGDVTNGALKQIVTACGDGAKAGSFASAYAAKFSK